MRNLIIIIGKWLLVCLMTLMIGFESDARTRVITIDGGFDSGPETSDMDRAVTGLLDDFMSAFRRHVPDAEETRVNSADSLLNFLLDMDCECGDTLYFVFSGHGYDGGINFSKGEDCIDRFLDYQTIANAIFTNNPECCCKIHFIINACHAGSAIEPLSREEHVKRVFAATSADALMYYRQALDQSDSIASAYLRRLISEMNDLADDERDRSIDDVIDEAHGGARDAVPADNWDEGERPEGFRKDTFEVRGHIREVFISREKNAKRRSPERRYYAVIEIDSPGWRRGQLDTVQLENEWMRVRRCKWVSTKIVYDRPHGLREKLKELVPIKPPGKQLITAHVMEIRSHMAKVHTTWPRHMFCRELWIDYPPEDRDPNSKLSVCRWIQQDVHITDPTGSATPVDPLRTFGRFLGGLVHITGIDRENGIIEFEVREPWLRRYGYDRARISEEEMEHLDSLIKVQDTLIIPLLDTIIVERTRPLESCDNIWLSLRVPGTADSSLWVSNGWIPKPRDTDGASHTRLRDHNIDRSGTLESVLPSIYVLNKDRETYKGRIHLALYPLDEPPDDHTHSYTEELDVYQTLIQGSHFSPPDGESAEVFLSLLPPECLNWLYGCVFPPQVEQIEEKISSTLKAAFLMNHLKTLSQSQLSENAPGIDRWKNLYLSDFSSPTRNDFSGQISKYYQLDFDYKNRIRSDRAFSNALLMESANCDVQELAMELTDLWEEASKSTDTDITFSEDELDGLEQYFLNYLNGVLSHSPHSSELRCPDEDDCLNRIIGHFKQLAINYPNHFSETSPDLTNIDLYRSVHQRQPELARTKDQSGMVPDFESSAIYTDYVDFYNLESFESRKIRFNTISGLEPGRGYRLSFWRGDQIDEGDEKAINTSDLNYQYQDTLHLFFNLKKEDRCQCPDPSVLDISSKATGRVSGNVFNLTVTNTGDEPVLCELGPYIVPPGRKAQGFILPDKTEISLLPGESGSFELFGHCLDFDKSPPKKGSTANPLSDWIALDGSIADRNFAEISPPKKPVLDRVQLLKPGTDELLNWAPVDLNKLSDIDQKAYLKQLGELNLKAGAVKKAVYNDFHYENLLRSPYGKSGHLRRTSIMQNMSWIYNSYLSGKEYRFEDYKKRAMAQLKENVPHLNLDEEKTVEEVKTGLRKIWETSYAIGEKAKLWKQYSD